MSDVVVTVVESVTNVAVTDTSVDVNVVESPVEVSVGTSGPQGATGATGTSYTPGDPIYVTVRNATGSTMVKGTIVYTSGANGTHTQVTPALATSDATSARTLGWLAEDLANNADGLCQVEGYLDGINTQGITAGAQLYLSGTTAGAFQVAKPSAPVHLVYVGVVAKVSAGNGRVYVKVQNGYELSEIHDVAIDDPANNQVLTYESSTGLWKNKTNTADGVQSVVFDAPLTGGTVSSTGTVGLDQSALTIAESQVTNLTTDLAAKANLAGGNSFTGSQAITSGTTVPVVVKAAATQSVNLTEWQNNSGGVDTFINNFNRLSVRTSVTDAALNVGAPSAATVGQIIRGAASQTANLQEWQNSAGTLLGRVSASGLGQFEGLRSFDQTYVQGKTAGTVQFFVRGAASQSANLTEWQNSAGTLLARVNSSGDVFGLSINIQGNSGRLRQANSGAEIVLTKETAATANPGAGIGTLYFRDGTNAGTLKLVVRAGTAGAETTILDNIPQ